jgi:hypothetical protein
MYAFVYILSICRPQSIGYAQRYLPKFYKGYDFEFMGEHVVKLLNIEPEDVLTRDKYKQAVKLRG